MPELPEVETIRRYLHKKIVGKTIQTVEVLNAKSFSGDISKVVNRTIRDTMRKGKVMSIQLDDGTFLSIHLKMSGQLIENGATSKSTRILFTFTDKTQLIFNDTRKFGWIRHTTKAEGTDAPDVTRPEFTLEYFASVVKKSRIPIKNFLMDQTKLAGVGNIYANDALFTAKILPSRPANSLTPAETAAIHESVIDTIAEGITYGGSSATDVYVSPDGSKGSYQDRFKVYGREDKPCHSCGALIVREKVGGRSNFFCRVCQK